MPILPNPSFAIMLIMAAFTYNIECVFRQNTDRSGSIRLGGFTGCSLAWSVSIMVGAAAYRCISLQPPR